MRSNGVLIYIYILLKVKAQRLMLLLLCCVTSAATSFFFFFNIICTTILKWFLQFQPYKCSLLLIYLLPLSPYNKYILLKTETQRLILLLSFCITSVVTSLFIYLFLNIICPTILKWFYNFSPINAVHYLFIYFYYHHIINLAHYLFIYFHYHPIINLYN